MLKSIHKFHKDYDFLNNKYHMKRIPYEGIDYTTVDHAFLASKTSDEHLRRKISATHIKDLNKMWDIVGTRQGWHGPSILKDLLEIKFGLVVIGAPDERLKNFKRLVATGDAKLIWYNLEHDNFYGECHCGQCDWVNGKNLLGYALETIRKKARDRVEQRHSLRRKCACQKEATRHLLWTAHWSPILTPSCDTCLAERVIYCASGSTDGYIVPYPVEGAITLPYAPIEEEFKPPSKAHVITDEELYGEFCGWAPAQTVTTGNKDERKWESFIWECG